jgi:hypothetical protein
MKEKERSEREEEKSILDMMKPSQPDVEHTPLLSLQLELHLDLISPLLPAHSHTHTHTHTLDVCFLFLFLSFLSL